MILILQLFSMLQRIIILYLSCPNVSALLRSNTQDRTLDILKSEPLASGLMLCRGFCFIYYFWHRAYDKNLSFNARQRIVISISSVFVSLFFYSLSFCFYIAALSLLKCCCTEANALNFTNLQSINHLAAY